MKTLLTFFTLVVVAATVQSQSLGVGTATPNPKAALDVVSSNQGFLMPRLSTNDKNNILSLTSAETGLMVYDTDLNAISIWDGTAWVTSLRGTGGLTSVANGLGNAGYFLNSGLTNDSSVIYVEHRSDVLNPFIAGVKSVGKNKTGVYGKVHSNNWGIGVLGEIWGPGIGVLGYAKGTSGWAGSFEIMNAANSTYALKGSTVGTGSAGYFEINNASNAANTIDATTNGTGGAAKFTVTNPASTMPALWAQTNSNQPLTAAVYGLNTGTGDVAGYFRISNAASNKFGLAGETNGSGSAVYGLNLGTGNGSYFRKNGATPNSASVWGDNFGNDGYGGIFQNISTTNPKPALFAESAGTGASIWALKSPGDISGDALLAENIIATGRAARFVTSNASNSSNTVEAETNNTVGGSAIRATHTGTGDAILATASSGSAGNFQNATAGNNASALFSITNAPLGFGLGTMNTAGGNAFAIFQGGMKVSTATLSAGTTITTRAIAYQITGGGPYTFSLTPAISDGEMFYVFNSSGGSVTVSGKAIPNNSGIVFIVLGGVARAF